jgi:hypothetical protein
VAKNTQLTNAAVNAEADALAALADHGWVDVLTGAQPATGDTAISTQVVLASMRLSSPAFGAASAGVITASSITSATASASGIAAWLRVYMTDHLTPLWDGSVGVTGSNSNLELGATNIVAGQTVGASAFVHTIAKATAGS